MSSGVITFFNMHNLFNPDYLINLCKKYGFVPGKKYGQNFLINPEPVEKMMAAVGITKGDTVVEIGPGFGALTFALAEKAGQIFAYEIEKKLMPYWEEKIKTHKNIKIVWGNVLRNPEAVKELDSYKLVANLPYQITSEVIRTFLEAGNKPEMMVLMVQKEVAERICAKPGDMSVLSVSVQYYARPEIVAQAPRSYFWPQPNVDSSIIAIKDIKDRPTDPATDKLFFKIVKIGFANRRKYLLKNLLALAGKKNKTKFEEIFAKIGLNPKVRAQELFIEQWRQLSTYLSPLVVV
jgi:16S rRNA (adenine1518-N6/adenine1519-N6)-dimethyltransferase